MAAKLLLLFHTADSNCIKNRQICYIGIKSMSIQPHSSLLHTVRTKAKAICPISAPSVTPICPGTAHRCETTCSVFLVLKILVIGENILTLHQEPEIHYHLMQKRLLPLLLTAFYAILVWASNDYHRQFMYNHIGTAQGLASQRVYSLAEDKFGGVWIGMKNGVARYNGRSLHNYTLANGNRTNDTGGLIIKVTKTAKDDILAYDNKGNIHVYDATLDRFTPTAQEFTAQFSKLNNPQGTLILKDIVCDAKDNLWAATSQGLFHVSADGKTIIRRNQDLYVNTTTIIDDDKLLVCSTTGAYLINTKAKGHDAKPSSITTLTTNNTETAYFDKGKGHIWLGTFNEGVLVFDASSNKLLTNGMATTIPHTPIRAIVPLNASTMLIGIDGSGVFSAKKDGSDAKILFSTDEKTGSVIHGNGIYDILCDSHDNIWIGSYTGGVDIAHPTGDIMELYEHKRGNAQSLGCDGVNDIIESGRFLVFATDNGISFMDRNSGHWTHTLKGYVVLTLCDDNGTILAGTYGNGVFSVSASGECRKAYSTENGMLTTDYVYSVWKDHKGNIWIGCLDGKLVQTGPSQIRRYDIENVQCITDMPGNRVAIGTANGFFTIDIETGKTLHRFDSGEFKGQDINSYVTSLLFTDDGTAWIATDGGGIYSYDIKTKHLSSLTIANGLPSNSISAMCFDKRGRIVASTDNGLAIVFPKTRNAVNINFIKGVDREYNRTAICCMANGHIVFGSNSGAVSINPSLIDKLHYKATLRIANLTVKGDKELDDKTKKRLHASLEGGTIELAHWQNTFDISFECIFYEYADDILYQYRLNGYNESWSSASTSSVASFTNLPAGKYQLEVRTVSRNDGRIIDNKTLSIVVDQPWWNSIWAWFVYFSIIAVIAYLLLKDYRGRLERKYFNEKIDFFINAAHDIRTPLSLVLAPLSDIANDSSLGAKSRKCLDIAMTNGNKLFSMISELLDFQKADVLNNPLKPVEVNVTTLLAGVANKFHLLAKEKDISLEIADCPDDILVSMDYSLGAKLFDNLMSNAIKYTPNGGHVSLRGWTENGKVKIEVRDNGIGIPKEAQKNIFKTFYRADNALKSGNTGSGLGLLLAQRIANLHKGKLTYESVEGEGTAFTLTLPLLKTDNRPKEEAEQTEVDNSHSLDIILFVDDNADLRSYFDMAFSDKFKVVTVENGIKALEYLKTNECDIVVSDVMMPGMQGDELCRRIKEYHDTSWMPVILLTAKAGKDFIIEGLETGADDYVTKPFDTEILRSKIETTLANRRRMSDYYQKRIEGRVSPSPSPSSAPLNQAPDCAFIDKATSIVMKNLADTDFDIDCLCREMAMSRTLFYGRLKTLTALAPQDFIRNIRLQRAASLLREGKTILDATAMTGFANSKHFSTVFKKHFGVPPSKFT